MNPTLSGTRHFLLIAITGCFLAVVGCQQEIISHGPAARAEGVKAYEEGQYADAAGSFRNAIRSDPRDYRSQFYLGQSYEQMRQYQQAIQAYKASLDAQPLTLAGKEDQSQRLKTIDALASVISKSDQRDSEINAIDQRAKTGNNAQDYLLLGKIYANRGDADSAIDAYNRAFVINPQDFTIAKVYGLYLAQIGQNQRAAQALRKAYTLNQNDDQVNEALRRLNVVPGPGLKDESALVKPPIPQGPLPEVDLSKFKIGGSNASTEEPAQTAQPANIPPPPTSATPPSQQRAVSTPRD